MCCRPAGNEIVEEGKKKTEEEVKAEQESVSKEQTAALKKALAQITVSLHCPAVLAKTHDTRAILNLTALMARDLCFLRRQRRTRLTDARLQLGSTAVQ